MDEPEDNTDQNAGEAPPRKESLLPYDGWMQDALRLIVVRALQHVSTHGLPGEHHFYISFRTDHPNTVIPKRLLAQYPQEMTIVLQLQFWDLEVDEAAGEFRVGLSFSGVPTTLHVPFAAITGFSDPAVGFALKLQAQTPPPEAMEEVAEEEVLPPPTPPPDAGEKVIGLDAFRRRTPPRT